MLLFLVFSMLYGAGVSVNLGQNTAENTPSSQIRGTVVDLLGRPINGARVKILVNSATVAYSESRANGKFTLSEVPSGGGEIHIESAGFKKYRKSLYLNPGQKLVFVAGLEAGLLSPGPDIHLRGRILDSRSKPVSSANVTARSIFNESIAVTTETTLGGDYHLKVASFGQYFVTVDLPGRKVEARIVLLDQERTFRTDFRLGRKIVAWLRNGTQRSWDAHSEVRAKHDRINILGRIRFGVPALACDPRNSHYLKLNSKPWDAKLVSNIDSSQARAKRSWDASYLPPLA